MIIPLLGSTAPNCLGVGKVSGAPETGSSSNTTDFLTACPSATSFVNNAEPVFQSLCVTCHSTSGSANSLFPLIAGTSLSNTQLNSNYGAALNQLLSNDGGNYSTNPILNNPLGNNGHAQIFTSQADTNYASVYQWVSDERASPCTAASN